MRRNCLRRAITLAVVAVVAVVAVIAVIAVVTVGTSAPVRAIVPVDLPVPAPNPPDEISATFTPKSQPGPCITIGGPPTVEFGRLAFGSGFGPGAASTVVASCGPAGRVQDVMASVSNATASGVQRWTSFDCGSNPPAGCVTPTNRFAYFLAGVSLTASPRTIGQTGENFDHQLRLPAPGSTGGGEDIRMTVTILGVLR